MNDRAEAIARAARRGSRPLARATAGQRTAAIEAVARQLRAHADEILAANAADLARATDLDAPMRDRLLLDRERLDKVARAVEEVAALPDPVGQTVKAWTRPNGLRVSRRRIPLGVVMIIYESRPNVTADAAALCLRSGNACILRGGGESLRSNVAIGSAIAAGLREVGLSMEAVQVLDDPSRDLMAALLLRDEEIDLVIPRGGEGLIRFVAERSRIPVIKHYRGNCHVFVERTADLQRALDICENGKVQRPGVCNAVESILVDAPIAAAFLPRLAARLSKVELRGDVLARSFVPTMTPATDEDLSAEYLDLVCSVSVVDGLDAAVAHIERYGSDHTEAIVTTDEAAAERFIAGIDSSTVVVNASTRFADGGELGLGAEIGISTTRLHAYGPMGAEELTTTQFVIHGDGQVRR
ncbi:MAG: glutamate-5-semialdehyde dehydrogenase [Polyangia bacterium]